MPSQKTPDFQLEQKALAQGYSLIAGLDEAGRGALFGPVVAAAVMFPKPLIQKSVQGWLAEIDDSKKLSPLKRKRLCRLILMHAAAVGWGWASSKEIDLHNIQWASLEAMRRAVEVLSINPEFLLVDGFNLNNVNYSQEKILQGDKKSITIAAASVVAKVLRDEMIIHLDPLFQGYSLSQNKGYGTKAHYLALAKQGPSVLHRATFNLKLRVGNE